MSTDSRQFLLATDVGAKASQSDQTSYGSVGFLMSTHSYEVLLEQGENISDPMEVDTNNNNS
eukprot:scaffold1586_cov88-Cylindrotheca_fusiformis.AAC.5